MKTLLEVRDGKNEKNIYIVLYFVFERLWKCVWSLGLDDWLADLTESKREDKWKPWQNKQEKHTAHSSVTPQSHSFSFYFMKTFMCALPKCISVSPPKYTFCSSLIIKFGHPSIIIIFPMLSHVYSHQKLILTHLFIFFFYVLLQQTTRQHNVGNAWQFLPLSYVICTPRYPNNAPTIEMARKAPLSRPHFKLLSDY